MLFLGKSPTQQNYIWPGPGLVQSWYFPGLTVGQTGPGLEVCGKGNSQRLERLQNQAMRIILAANRKTCSQDMRAKLCLLSLDSRRRFLRLQFVFKIVHNINCPHQLEGYLVKRSEMHNRDLRDSTLLHVIATKTKMGQSSFKCAAAREWNDLPRGLRELQILSKFKADVFKYFLELDTNNHQCSLR